MSNIKSIITGTVITVLIGGTAYTVTQEDIARNLANDTGLTQEQAEQYVKETSNENLYSFTEVGEEMVSFGKGLVDGAVGIDCINYEYEWESSNIACSEGRVQVNKLGTDMISLGEAYKELEFESSGDTEIQQTIDFIDQLNFDLTFLEIVSATMSNAMINEMRTSNSYNKAVLQAALQSQ